MPLGGALIAGGASLLGGVLAGSAADKSAKAAADLQKQAMDRLAELDIPSIEAQKIVLTNPRLVGELVPEMEGAVGDLESAAAAVQTKDSGLESTQLDALDALTERGQGGLTPADMADINAVRNKTMGSLKGQDASILQNMEQRGLGGSGNELAMRLDAKSKAQSRASEESDKLAAMNYNAKMAALQGAGNMAGNIQQSQFGRDMGKAGQLDAISKFNQANQIGLGQRNIDRANIAQAGNLTAKQNIENKRAANANTEEIHNQGLAQQEFENKYKKAGGQAAQLNNQAKSTLDSGATQATNTANMWGSIGKIAATGVDAYGKKDNKKDG